jgi:hypothetical protein
MGGVELEAVTWSEAGSGSGRMSVRLGVRGPVTLYEMVLDDLHAKLVVWTDGQRLRTYESKGRKYFDGPVGDAGSASRAFQEAAQKVAELYWSRFARLTAGAAVSKTIRDSQVKIKGQAFACRRLDVRSAEVLDVGDAVERLWIEKQSGLVMRSEVTSMGRGAPMTKRTEWTFVKPGPASEDAMAFARPANAVDVSEPVMVGK